MKKTIVCAISLLAFGFVAPVWGQLADEPRPFAPGVLKVIEPDLRPEDSFSPALPIPGLTAEKFSPNFAANSETLFGQTRKVVFFRDVWALEFATIGLRQIELQFKNPDGTTTRKNFFYLPYRVRNLGKSLTYQQVKEGLVSEFIKYELKRSDGRSEDEEPAERVGPSRFLPEFSLEGWVVNSDNEYQRVVYRDQYLPEVVRTIQSMEDPNRPLLDQAQIEAVDFPAANSETDPGVWGVAVWPDVNPNVDFISVFARGLTNAYRIRFNADGSQTLLHKTIHMNFWRPGDSVQQTRDEIIYGIPLVDRPEEQIEICRRYQLPGPRLNFYLLNEEIDGSTMMGGVDAEVDLATLESPAVAQLTGGEIPEGLAAEMKGRGFDLSTQSAITEVVPGKKWRFSLDLGGEPRGFEVRFEPEFWEKDGKGIRFLKSLDHLWIYR